MMPRFRLPLTKEDTFTLLVSAVQGEVESRYRTFIPNENLTEQLQKMAAWLTNKDSKFGMLLCGGCGNGKTTIVKAFQQVINALEIPSPTTNKSYAIRIMDAKTITHIYRTDYKQWLEFARMEMLAIDDLGIEPREVMDFGNVGYPVVDLLTKRYENQLFTIITSNLTPPEISAQYGECIADRLREMMERITFTNSSYRLL